MEKQTKNKINILNVIQIFLAYWPLFALSCFLFLAFAAFYLRYSAKTYSVSSRILISKETMRVRSSDTYVNVNDLMNQEKNLSNEINYLKSTPLIKEVINEMNLFTSYYYKKDKIPLELGFGLQNLYKQSPFIVIVNENNIQPLSTLFYIKIIDDGRFMLHAYEEDAYLYDFNDESVSSEEITFSISGTYSFGEIIENQYCSFKILLNSNYNSEQYQGIDLYFRFNSPQNMAYQFQEALRVSSNFYESSIANLTFEWENLVLAKEFLSKLIDKYIERNLEKKNYDANNTIEYIESQLANISSDLGQSKRQLLNFRLSRDVMDIDNKTRTLIGQIQELQRNRDQLQSQLQNLRSLKEYFDQNKGSQTFIAPTSTGMSDQTLATLIQELTMLSRERQNLISTNQLKNPRIKTLESSMASIIKVITDNINFNLVSTENEIAEIDDKLANLNVEYTKLPQTQRELLDLERNFNINDEVYTTLLNRRIQAKIIKASNRPDIEIIEPVHYDMVTSPSTKKIAVVALFLGMFFPGVYVIFINFLSAKIRSKDELANYTDLISIGDIPHNEKNDANVIYNQSQAPIAERFHFLRTNLIYFLQGKKNQLILVTSTLPGEGKSFVALNLALSFSSTNHKTLLVGFDLRKNNQTFEEFNLDTRKGLNSYLIDTATLDEIILETFPNLDYIPKGKTANDPVTLLALPKIQDMFEKLREKYDYIIIDTPPFGLVSDAFLLMQNVDISLYVSRLGVITKKALRQSMEELYSKNLENVYLVKNDVTKIDKAYYYKYSYREPGKRKLFGFLKSNKS